MNPTTRRIFIRKSLATSVTISFSGLIRAHGEEGGGTTWNPNQSTYSSTNGGGTTTWDPNQTTYQTTWNPEETTVVASYDLTDVPHCPAHGQYCTYISNITVTFDSVSNPPVIPNFTTSGRIFHGLLTYTSTYCKDGKQTLRSFPVHSGGYRSPSSNVNLGDDTTCPGGSWDTTPAQNGGKVNGFPMSTPDTGRSEIEIHGPEVSEGCIVFDSQEHFDLYAAEMRCNNYDNCVHNPPNPVVTTVVYGPNATPNGNVPG